MPQASDSEKAGAAARSREHPERHAAWWIGGAGGPRPQQGGRESFAVHVVATWRTVRMRVQAWLIAVGLVVACGGGRRQEEQGWIDDTAGPSDTGGEADADADSDVDADADSDADADIPLALSVTSGFDHSCLLTTDGKTLCWGENGEGQASPPSDNFPSVDAGALHTCGLAPTGALVLDECSEWPRRTTRGRVQEREQRPESLVRDQPRGRPRVLGGQQHGAGHGAGRHDVSRGRSRWASHLRHRLRRNHELLGTRLG